MSTPKTIKELKQWYIDRNLPPEYTTRFFIGENYEGAKAFGIYMDEKTEEFIVYKNKADGTRAIRYQGKDEAYAVKELYLKLKEEIANQKGNKASKSNDSGSYSRRSSSHSTGMLGNLVLGIVSIVFVIVSSIVYFSPTRGYYFYDNLYYYYQNGTWYNYNKTNGWHLGDTPKGLTRHAKKYFQSYNFSELFDIEDFEFSGYYEEPETSNYDDDDDSSSDWDSSDSWDSSSTDWDSDW